MQQSIMSFDGNLVTAQYVMVMSAFLSYLVCYMERTGSFFAVAMIAEDHDWTERTLGSILASFFVGYSFFQIPSAILVRHFGYLLVLFLSFLLWSIASMLMPLFLNPSPLFLCVYRFSIGAAQSMFIPAVHTCLAVWTDDPKRSSESVPFATSGMYLGSALGIVLCPQVLDFGPNAIFISIGVLGLVCAFIWLLMLVRVENGYVQPPKKPFNEIDEELLDVNVKHRVWERLSPLELPCNPYASKKTLRWTWSSIMAHPIVFKILSNKCCWSIVSCNFAFHYSLYVLINWLPSFYSNGSLSSFDWDLLQTVPFLLIFITSLGTTQISKWFPSKTSDDILRMRRFVNLTGLSISSLSFAFLSVSTTMLWKTIWSSCALSGLGLSRGGWAVHHLDITSRPSSAGMLMAISNAFGTLSGIMCNLVTGSALDALGNSRGWMVSFSIPTCLCLSSAILFQKYSKGIPQV